MRALPIAAALIMAPAPFAVVGVASAAPASVSVTIGPELQAKAAKDLGPRDVDFLAKDLQKSVEKQLAKTGAYDGARIELQLTDVQPNRPTFKQMSDRPGLSFESFGVGRARIDGHAISPPTASRDAAQLRLLRARHPLRAARRHLGRRLLDHRPVRLRPGPRQGRRQPLDLPCQSRWGAG